MDFIEIAKKELEKLDEINKELVNIDFKDKKKVSSLFNKQKRLLEIKEVYDLYMNKLSRIEENRKLLDDPELAELAGEEIESLKQQNEALIQKLELMNGLPRITV